MLPPCCLNKTSNEDGAMNTAPNRPLAAPAASNAASAQASPQQQAKKVAIDLFPMKLHKLLEAAHNNGHDDIVTWLPDGKAFKVLDRTKFYSELMPEYFGSSKFRSFQRSLNLWNFDVTSKHGPHKGEIYHPLFRRDNPKLCELMKREKIKNPQRPQEAFLPQTIGTVPPPASSPVPSFSKIMIQHDPKMTGIVAAQPHPDSAATPSHKITTDSTRLRQKLALLLQEEQRLQQQEAEQVRLQQRCILGVLREKQQQQQQQQSHLTSVPTATLLTSEGELRKLLSVHQGAARMIELELLLAGARERQQQQQQQLLFRSTARPIGTAPGRNSRPNISCILSQALQHLQG